MEHLKVSREAEGRVALITLARSEQMNALSSGLLRELERAISEAEDSPEIRAVVVTVPYLVTQQAAAEYPQGLFERP